MRIRITFSKTGALKYIGNLDLHNLWERGARRAGLPLAYTQGFHPQPKINLASPLPLGFSSRCEVVDLRLNEDVDIHALPPRLQAAMPSGIGILKAESVDENLPALQTQIVSAEYEVTLTEAVDGSDPSTELRASLKRKMDELLAGESLPRERRGKIYDLRPLIEKLALTPPPLPEGEGQGVRVVMQLSAREGATGRPDEVLAALGISPDQARIERSGLIFR